MGKRELVTDVFKAGRNIIEFLIKTANKRKNSGQVRRENERIIKSQTGRQQFMDDKRTQTSRIDVFGSPAIKPKFEKVVEDVQAGQRVEGTKKAQREIAQGWRNVETGKKAKQTKSHKEFVKKFAIDNVKAAIKEGGGAKKVRESKKLGRKLDKITEN